MAMTRRVNRALELLADAILKRRKEEEPPGPEPADIKSLLARFADSLVKSRAGKGQVRIVLVTTLIIGAALPAVADEGDLDQTFADLGTFQIDLNPGGNDFILALTVSEDGTIYAGDHHSPPVQVLALRSNGTLDDAYGTGGVALIDAFQEFIPHSAALDAAGRLVVAGTSDVPMPDVDNAWIARLDNAGALDSSFSGDGHVFVSTLEGAAFQSVWVDPQGRIVAVGARRDGGEIEAMAARFLGNGEPDPSFGDNGIVAIPDIADLMAVHGAPHPGGGIVLTGSTQATSASNQRDFFVLRLGDDGSIDEAFGTVTVDVLPSDEPKGVVITSTGRIVVAGNSDVGAAVVRLLPNGDFDRSLRGSGRVSVDDIPGIHTALGVAVDPLGRIVLAGNTDIGGTPLDGFVARLRFNGALDPEFGNEGVSVVALPGDQRTNFFSVAVQADGKIVAGGDGPGVGGSDALVARFEASIPVVSFADDDGSTFEREIEKLGAHRITLGCNPPANSRFCPNDPVTRGQMAAFIVRALGYTNDGGGDLFTDDDSSTFEADIDRLATAGVTRGCNPPANDRFCPNDPVTRGQMAAFIVRALGLP